ncbi:MAG: GAF domain-containing protein [Anaerolineae bacterium]|nr:GAF domain-containing protein [Anaerolineae bacterium]
MSEEFKRQTEAPTREETLARRALWAAIITAGTGLTFVGAILYLIFQTPAWQLFALLVLSCVVLLVGFVSIWQIRRGQVALGIWLLFGYVVPPMVAALLVRAAGIPAAVFIILLVSLIVAWVVPAGSRRWPVVFSVAAAVMALALEWLNPAFRLDVPQLVSFTPIATGVMVAAFVVVMIYQVWAGSGMRVKLTVPSAITVFIILGVFSYILVLSIQTVLTNQVGELLLSHAQDHTNQITGFFREKVMQLQVLSLAESLRESVTERNAAYSGSQAEIQAEIQALDKAWVAAGDNDPFILGIISDDPAVNSVTHSLLDFLKMLPEHTEVFITDRYGATVAASDRLSDYDQADEGWWQATWNEGQGAIYISEPEYDESAGTTALLVGVPITSYSGEVIGVLRSTLIVDALKTLIARDTLGESGHAVLFDSAADVIFDPRAETINSAGLPPALRQEIVDQEAHFTVTQDQHGTGILVGHAPVYSDLKETAYSESEQAILAAVNQLGWAVAFRQNADEALVAVNVQSQTMILMGVVANAVVITILVILAQLLVAPLLRLTAVAQKVAGGDLTARAQVETRDEVGSLATVLNNMTAELQETLGGLEQQVQARTRDLEQRSAYLAASAEVGRAAGSILDRDELLRRVADLIRGRFGLYYVGLFLVEADAEHPGAKRWAVLRAGTGEAGQKMMARGHRLPVGADSESMIGRCVATGQADILGAGEGAADATKAADAAEAARFANPDLPETRSEAALPLRSRGKVIGALTVQSVERVAFDEDTIVVLQTMADQVAVALDNAALFAEAQEALAAARRAYGELSREAWADLLRARTQWGFRYAQQSVALAERIEHPEMLEAERTGQSVQGNSREGTILVVPIKESDHVVGTLHFHKGESGEAWTPEQIALLETLTGQLSIALESARLYQDTQQRAAREQMVSQVSGRIRETLDLEMVLKTAAEQVRQALDAGRVVVRLAGSEQDGRPAGDDAAAGGASDQRLSKGMVQ